MGLLQNEMVELAGDMLEVVMLAMMGHMMGMGIELVMQMAPVSQSFCRWARPSHLQHIVDCCIWSLGDDTDAFDRQSALGSGRPCTVRVAGKIDEVDDLILSQDNVPNAHKTQQQIACQTGMSLMSDHGITKSDCF